jgi:hypothetical protein
LRKHYASKHPEIDIDKELPSRADLAKQREASQKELEFE